MPDQGGRGEGVIYGWHALCARCRRITSPKAVADLLLLSPATAFVLAGKSPAEVTERAKAGRLSIWGTQPDFDISS